jgi:hypothetical protein
MRKSSANLFPDMAALVPQAARGCASIKHLVVDTEGGRTASYVYGEFKDPSPAGTYTTLSLTDDAGKPFVMMSDFYYERITCAEVVERAHGDVLIAGLGLGMILHPMLQKPEVRSVTVIEKFQDVVDLISPTLPIDSRLTIFTADIFDWQPAPGRSFDIVWFDIWPDIEARRLPEMDALHRRYLPYLNVSNPRCWMESWHRRETIDGIRRQELRRLEAQALSDNNDQGLDFVAQEAVKQL